MGEKALRDGVISTLRACLISAPGGISLSKLNSDYRQLIGEGIPFRKLGFATLDDLLMDVDGFSVTKKAGDWNVVAIPSEKSVHVTKLIARQKSSSKRRSRGLGGRSRRPAPSSWEYSSRSTTTRPMSYASRDGRSNQRTSYIPPLMMEPQRKPIPPLFDRPPPRPRFMLPNTGVQQSSPSKRLNDRTTRRSQSQNSSNNTSGSSSPVIAYKNRAAVEAAVTQRLGTQQTSTPLPSTVSRNTSNARNSEQSRANANVAVSQQAKPLNPLSERLKLQKPKEQPRILSPLSPSMLVNGPSNPSVPNANSRPTTAPQPVKHETQNGLGLNLFSQHQDPCKQLDVLVRNLHLPEPIYKIMTYGVKRQRSCFGCKVEVGSYTGSSYPEEMSSPEEAKKIAAAKVVKDILLKEGPSPGLSQTGNKNSIKERVKAIVSQHQNGVFMNQIPTYYKELYREYLPQDWEKIIEECSDISKEKGADDSTILRIYVPRQEARNDSDKISEALSPRLEKIQLSPIGPAVPGVIKPPSEEYWDVHITTVLNTADIWARLIGEEYSEQFETMLTEMETHYKKLINSSGTSGIQAGYYYAVEEQETWHRVQCLDFDEATGKAEVFFIDHGDEDTIHYRKLFPLEKRFCSVPAQAINLSLADLEEFGSCYEVIEYLEELFLGQTFVAQVVNHGPTDKEDWLASVVLFDTSNPNDVNMNEILFNAISDNILSPKLKEEEGQVSEVYVSHVTEMGDVYLQVKSDSMIHLINLTNKLIQTGLTTEDVQRSEPKRITKDKVYFVRCFEDGNWYRGVVGGSVTNIKTSVFLVDFGKTIVIDQKENLLVLDQLSEVLAKYPYQALRVRLHNIPETMFNSEMVTKLTMLAPPDKELIVKIVTPATGSNPPVVELFKRTEPDNLLASINHTLAIDPDLIGSNGDGNNNTRPRKRLERTISRHGTTGDGDAIKRNLIPPEIPGIGKYFDVHITMAANPGNFTVQPYDDRIHLEAMMVKLQEVCVNYGGLPPSFESVKEGSLYAAKHFDGHYYRVCVSKIIGEQMVTVYFCDFGDVSVLTLDKLQPLGRQFLDLPYQAIRARLVGIQPLNIDWSVEDCLRFQELVVERNFVSIVVDLEPDRLSPADTVLGLKLIDVSEETDIHLDQLFVLEGRATATEI